ncbi:MAG TPA: polyphosphate kinase 2 family protein [Candidatus Kapabacteria bacterium]|nr:polyphosphate kinase 2 family protein [Candidatus Kapabacteria bacterium]
MHYKDFQVPTDGGFSLNTINPAKTDGFRSKRSADKKLAADIEELSEMQSKLFAQDSYALLVIFQGIDTAGKDGAVKHVLTGVNPQGVDIHNFRVPSAEELNHDYLWRAMKVLPERGKIGIFNRSYYEEVLAVRVHPELLQKEKLPESARTHNIWQERFEDINNFEHYLVRNGIIPVKFHLRISKEEQRKRLLERIEEKDKNYKIGTADVYERTFWDEYMKAYDEMLRHTSTKYAPWYVIPSDHKWFTRVMVADILINTLKSLELNYPTISAQQKKEIARAKRLLENEK